MPSYDPTRIAQLEERLSVTPPTGDTALLDFEMLADLYLQADSYLPALETIDRLLALPAAGTLSPTRRAALESKAVGCRLASGDCASALAHCRELLVHEDQIDSAAVRARIHVQCADALFRLGRLPECREHGERGLTIADAASETALSAAALNQLGRHAYREGDLARARDLYEQSLALYRRAGDDLASATVRSNLGLIFKNLCEWDEAARQQTAALDLYRAMGRMADSGRPLMNLGIIHQKRGDWAGAQASYAEAERVFQQVGDTMHLAYVAIGLGNVARLERRFADAETLLESALERARRSRLQREEVLAIEFLGELEFDRARPERALARYEEALLLAERIAPEGDLVVELERRRAEALCAVGRFDAADRACEKAIRLARVTDDRLEYAVAHRVAGEIAFARGERAAAIDLWKRAVDRLTSCHERLEQGRAHLLLGRALTDGRDARRHLYRAIGLLSDLTSVYWLEKAESELARVSGEDGQPAAARPASLLGRRHRAPSLVACSNAMRRIESLAQRAATTELSVVVTGETGTGKELIARTIHGLSPRAGRPFLAVNCGALRADLALSQLFGYRKGAFTGAHADGVGLVEAANGGTLFLDEVGELPLDVQVTLLRFLETGEYLRLGEPQARRADVRIIAATNRELRGGEGEKSFRRDLLFRLNEIEIELPSLRERAEDIVPLARHFLAFYGGLDAPELTAEAEGLLRSYQWPGNVRELENVMKRVAALHAGDRHVDATEMVPFLSAAAPRANGTGEGHGNGVPDERARILAAYREVRGNKSRLAERLGVSRKTLYARLKRLDLQLPG